VLLRLVPGQAMDRLVASARFGDPGDVVVLQDLSGGAWQNVATQTLDARHLATFKVSVSASRGLDYRVVLQATSAHGPGVSGPIRQARTRVTTGAKAIVPAAPHPMPTATAASPTPSPASPSPSPASPTPSPASPSPSPASPTPSPASPTPSPASPTPSPASPTLSPDSPASSPANALPQTRRDDRLRGMPFGQLGTLRACRPFVRKALFIRTARLGGGTGTAP
jgi:hypothetical protein